MKSYQAMADEQLVTLYSKGENKAFDTLLARYKQRLYSYIYYIVRNQVLTEDIFQETFVKAIITIRQDRYSENGKFAAWLTRIAHNLIIDYFRQEKYEKNISCDFAGNSILNDIKLSEGTVENRIVNHQVMNDVRKLINYLPKEQREVVEMRFYRNMSFKEIAEITHVSINTSLGRMRYAVINMRRLAKKNHMVLTID